MYQSAVEEAVAEAEARGMDASAKAASIKQRYRFQARELDSAMLEAIKKAAELEKKAEEDAADLELAEKKKAEQEAADLELAAEKKVELEAAASPDEGTTANVNPGVIGATAAVLTTLFSAFQVFQTGQQPSGQPSSQPSGQPSSQPISRPSSQPSSQPSMQPTRQVYSNLVACYC